MAQNLRLPRLNQVALTGYVGNPPRVNDNHTAANFSLAVTERWKDKESQEWLERTDWFEVVCFGRLAERCADGAINKGSALLILGKLRENKWKDKDGKEHRTPQVLAGQIQTLTMTDKPTGRKEAAFPGDPDAPAPEPGDADLDDIPF